MAVIVQNSWESQGTLFSVALLIQWEQWRCSCDGTTIFEQLWWGKGKVHSFWGVIAFLQHGPTTSLASEMEGKLSRRVVDTKILLKKPGKPSFLPPKSFLCSPPIFFGKEKFCTGAGRCMLSFSFSQRCKIRPWKRLEYPREANTLIFQIRS